MIDRDRRVMSTSELGRRNAEAVLEQLDRREPSTTAELFRATGLSRSTVDKALELLVENGAVQRSSPVALINGRPAALYSLRDECCYLLAADVGAHTVRVRLDPLGGPSGDLTAADHRRHEMEPAAVDPEEPTENRLRVLEELTDRALASAGVTRERVCVATAATPGVVDRTGVITACRVIRAEDWVGARLRTRLSRMFPAATVAVDNDANLAVLAEQRFGVAGHAEEVVAVSAGRRIGFGILRGGVLHRGAHNQAGEAANIRDSSWGEASRWLSKHDTVAARLFESAGRGDPQAMETINDLAQLLGTAFAEMVHTIDPELIVLGGAISAAGATVLDPVTEHFIRACRGTLAPPLVLSTLGDRGVLLGAAEHARRVAFAHLLDTARPVLPNATPRARR